MGALWLPSDDELVVAQREPNLLVPGRQPLAGVRLRQEWIAKGLARVISPIPGYSLSVGVSGVVTTDADGRGYAAVAGGYWRTDEQNIVSGSDEFTIVAAFKSAAGIEDGGRSLYVERPDATQIVKLGIADTSFKTHLVVRNGSGAIMFAASAANHNDGVMHVAAGVRYASNDHKLFVDGVLAGSSTGTVANSFPSASYGYVANDPFEPTTSFVTGSIPLVALFTKALSADDVTRLSRDYYAELFQPANQSPFLISIPGGGGAAYDETFSASASSAFTLSDSWALNYAETFGASAASGAELTDSYQTPSANYDETFAASAASGAELADAWSLDYSETFAATAASGATLTDAWLLNYAETFAAASAAAFTLTDAWALDYAETFAASAASGCDLTHSYAVGNNYAETFAASSVSVATLTHAYSVQYAETFAAQALADCTLVAAWALDYAETFAASSATDCVLTDAYGTPAPGAFDETFAAAAVSACDLTHAFSTPAAIGRVINPTLAASGVPARTLKGLKLIN